MFIELMQVQLQGFQNKAQHNTSVGHLSKFGKSLVATFPLINKEKK